MPVHDKYEANLEHARKFEDYVSLKLYNHGIVICLHGSMNYQRKGESRAGFEIKYDDLRHKTGNLFIETYEKHHQDAPWKPAGINGQDNRWLYVIGDYHKLWLFSCTMLRLIESKYESRETKTAKGFLLPIEDADKFSSLVINEGGERPSPIDQLRLSWKKATKSEQDTFLKEVS